MPRPLFPQNPLEPVADPSGLEFPPRFKEAVEQVRAMSDRCGSAGIPNETILAALLIELMPRLVDAYGSVGVAAMLGRLAREIAEGGYET